MTLFQTLVLALLQGVTELFPVSSLGHGVIIPGLLGWPGLRSPTFLPVMVVLHVGTAIALLLFFGRDWINLAVAFFSRDRRLINDRRLAWNLIWGTLPAVVLVLLFEKRIRDMFGDARIAAGFLAINGLILLVGERMRRRAGRRQLDQLTPGNSVVIGTVQALALIPGISRSGVTLVGGLLSGLTYEASARFAFLLATPIIAGAAVHEVPKLLTPEGKAVLGPALAGGVVAGVAAYASIAFLMRYFRKHEVDAVTPFGYYCLVAGLAALTYLTLV